MSIYSYSPGDKIDFADKILNIFGGRDYLGKFQVMLEKISQDKKVVEEIMDFVANTIIGYNCDIEIFEIEKISKQFGFIVLGCGVWNLKWNSLDEFVEWRYGISVEELEEEELQDAKSYYISFAESLNESDYASDIFNTVGYNNDAIRMIVEKASQNGEVIYNQDGIIFSLGKLKYYTPNK